MRNFPAEITSGFHGNSQFSLYFLRKHSYRRYFNQAEKRLKRKKFFANIHQAIKTTCQTALLLRSSIGRTYKRRDLLRYVPNIKTNVWKYRKRLGKIIAT